MLNYPYQIRADSITAVGAPSSVAFLIKAIYWLYLVVRTYHRSPFNSLPDLTICVEELEDTMLLDKSKRSKMPEIEEDEDPLNRNIWKDILEAMLERT